MKKYDYVIVGAGLFGSTFAFEMKKMGKNCLVIDKRDHIGGNIYCENVEGINTHKYGAHIFHTDDEKIWNYVNQFVKFNNYVNSPLAIYGDELYNLPFNMNTFSKMWNIKTPQEAKKIINEQRKSIVDDPKNLEEQAISLVGYDVYNKLIKGYTEKQWGRKCTELPPFIIKRLPVRYTYNNNYFNHKYQGIPIGGYNIIIEKMLEGIDIKLGVDFFSNKKKYKMLGDKVLYTGMIDEYFEYKYGRLKYRSLEFENQIINTSNFQGNSVVNYTKSDVPYTRIIEHKHFEFGTQEKTVITKEYSREWKPGDIPYYPINDKINNDIYNKYKFLAEKEEHTIFGGRLAEYKYYDMNVIIEKALELVKNETQ
jgi:UDP-galactopyranose mutase